MKRFLGIFIALVLIVSTFAVTTVAFAAEDDKTPSHTVTFNPGEFESAVVAKHPQKIEMSKTFSLDNKWWEDAETVKKIFTGINYRFNASAEVDDESDPFTLTYDLGEHVSSDELNSTTDSEQQDQPKYKNSIYNDKEYKENETVTLAKAPAAEKGFVFAGWKLVCSSIQQGEKDVYAAGYRFNMPAAAVTVEAQWLGGPLQEGEEESDVEIEIPPTYADDVIYLLYCGPNDDPKNEMKNWLRIPADSTISVTTYGEWAFRFAVVDGAKASVSGYTFNWDDVLATTYDNVKSDADVDQDCTLYSYTEDTTHPVVDLSSTMKNKAEEGLTVGTPYTISTSLEITDANDGSPKTTFDVYKQVGKKVDGADKDGWIKIYDRESKEVTKGYENCISASGSSVTITPLKKDVSDKAVYKIVYYVVDSEGFFGIQNKLGDGDELKEYNPELLLKVKAAEVTPEQKAMEAWKIVLYVIAGLSAVGIVVMLCINPKQKSSDGRANTGNTAEGKDEPDNKDQQ